MVQTGQLLSEEGRERTRDMQVVGVREEACRGLGGSR